MSFTGHTASRLHILRSMIEAGLIEMGEPLKAPGQASPEAVTPEKAAFGGKAWYQMGRLILTAYTSLMLDVDIRWHGPLPEGPKIWAPNHPTTTDPLYLLPLFSERVSFLITAASFDVPVVGAYLRAAGHVPALRGSGGATVEAMIRRVEAGRSVAIFPEGALSPRAGGFHRPHSGVARIALRSGAPVIPIGIGLRRDRMRISELEVAGEKATGHLYSRGPYAITVGQPLTFVGDVEDHEQVRVVANEIMQRIRDLARESDRRIQAAQAAGAGTRPAPSRPTRVAGAAASGGSLP